MNGKGNGKHHVIEIDDVADPVAPVITEFPYNDESGELHFVVVRIESGDHKAIKQKRPDPARAGRWLSSVKGCRVIPYRFPELIEAIANDHAIAIVEGEKKADLLASWGIAATCNAGGAGKWKDEHAAFLKGADVVILPDNDHPGFEHAASVAKSLVGIAKRIRRVVLPDLPAKGDIVDWAAANHTREELDELIAQAPDWNGDSTPEQQQVAPAAAPMGGAGSLPVTQCFTA
jgi:hypothetical protein